VVEPIIFRVTIVEVIQQGAVYLVALALHISDTALVCLTICIFLIVSKLMLRSESITSRHRCISFSAAIMSGLLDYCWIILLATLPGADCCSAAFCLAVALA